MRTSGNARLADAAAFAVADKECDLILKGGVMSGVIQPLGVCELAKAYRFRSVGGTSSGATIASFTAAAEYARTTGRATQQPAADRSVAAGFHGLEQFARDLESEPEKLVRAFRPDSATKPLYDIAFGGQLDRARGGAAKPRGNPLNALWRNAPRALTWGIGLLAAAVMLGLLSPQYDRVTLLVHTPGFRPRIEGDLIAIGAVVVTLAAFTLGFVGSGAAFIGVLIYRKWLPAFVRNGFGLSHGLGSSSGAASSDDEYLTAWAQKTINELAGRSGGDQPLTFKDLWTCDKPPGDAKQIQLEFMATNLTAGRPFHLPRDLDSRPPFYFDRREWVRYFPDSVIQHLLNHAGRQERPAAPQSVGNEHLVALPDWGDLPVIVAWRMSASFPFVLSAVPLWSVDTNAPGDPALLPLERCWFADGGITSDFPIHFFDSLVPSRPTFGIDFRSETAAYPMDPCNQEANVWMAQTNDADRTEWWTRIDSDPKDGAAALRAIAQFASMAIGTALSWKDNALAHAPGSRDRIVHVKLDPRREGGLNIGMPAAAIHALNERGAAAGRLLRKQYTITEPDLEKQNKERLQSLTWDQRRFWKPTTVSWKNHQWVRYRIAMSTLQDALTDFRAAWVPGDYQSLIDRKEGDMPHDYQWTDAQRDGDPAALTRELLDALHTSVDGAKPTDFRTFESPPEPDPMPVLRVTPKN